MRRAAACIGCRVALTAARSLAGCRAGFLFGGESGLALATECLVLSGSGPIGVLRRDRADRHRSGYGDPHRHVNQLLSGSLPTRAVSSPTI